MSVLTCTAVDRQQTVQRGEELRRGDGHRPQDAGPRRRAELGQGPFVHAHHEGLPVLVGDAVVDPPRVARPLVGVGPGDATDHERLVFAVRPGAELLLVEVERAADEVAGRLVVAERGQLRFQQLPLEVGLEDEGVGGTVVGERLLLVVEQEGHAVGPDERAAQGPEAVGMNQELAVAEGDDRRAGQAGDAFEVVGPGRVGDATQRVEPRPPAIVEAPGGGSIMRESVHRFVESIQNQNLPIIVTINNKHAWRRGQPKHRTHGSKEVLDCL